MAVTHTRRPTSIGRHPARGFTLLELLVVIFIIGVIAAMATLSVGVATRETGTDKETQRLADLLSLASEEAVLQGREFGLTFYARQYEFSTFDPGTGTWEPVAEENDLFALRRLPADAEIELEIEDRIVRLLAEKPPPRKKASIEESGDDDARRAPPATPGRPTGEPSGTGTDEASVPPQVFILSSGDITPFRVHLRPGTGLPGLWLEVAENGSTEVTRDES